MDMVTTPNTKIKAIRFDVPTVIRDLLATACHYNVLDMADAFVMGMNQEQLDNWEDWDVVVDEVINVADASRQSLTNGADAHAAILMVAERYWTEKRDAAADRACEYTGPEL